LFPELPAAFTGFPGSHAFTVGLFAGLVVYFILGTFNQWRSRLRLVIAASSVVVLVGFSRVYLGLQWLSSVLAGLALAALWLTFLITAAELRRRYAGEFPWRTGWQPLQISARQRRLLLTVAALATTAAIAHHLLRQLGFLS
ncbi:MAG: phosphatase PAP2 family protein, partial [Desulfuromonadales bacterium]|nr:phosphatase PAP2 family protein [Desulfuromonadales bacterium]